MKKKSLKKVTSAVLVAAMSMGLLAGCGGSKSSEEAKTDADGATVIKFGIHVANPKKQETVTYNIVQGFNKENKGKYKVEFVAADTEAHSKNMKLAAQDGSLPEIVHLDSAEAPEYNEAGYLLDMSDFLKENKDIDDALDGMEDAFNDGKVQYGLPYQSNVQGFFNYRNLLGGLYRENQVKSRNYEAVKSSKKWENVGNSYIIPALLLYRYSYI